MQVREPCSGERLIEKFTSVGREADHDTSPKALFPRFRGELPSAATCRTERRSHPVPQG